MHPGLGLGQQAARQGLQAVLDQVLHHGVLHAHANAARAQLRVALQLQVFCGRLPQCFDALQVLRVQAHLHRLGRVVQLLDAALNQAVHRLT